MWLRIPVVASTSLAWTCILSAMRGASAEVEADPGLAMDAVGNQLRAFSRLRHTRAQLDPGKTYIVITAAGQRQSGMLHELTEVILRQAGNVVESRCVSLSTASVQRVNAARNSERLTPSLVCVRLLCSHAARCSWAATSR
jgi:hypothetical protein